MTFAQVAGGDPEVFRTAALAWRRLGREMAGRSAQVAEHRIRLEQGWTGGTASIAAHGAMSVLERRFTDVSAPLILIAQVLEEHAALVETHRRRAFAVLHGVRRPPVAAAGSWRLRVDDAGGVHLDGEMDATGKPTVEAGARGRLEALRAVLDRQGRAVVAEAVSADESLAARLEALAPEKVLLSGTVDLYVATSQIPGPGARPADVRAWWASLTPDQRRYLIAGYPDRIGNLDGIPVLDRDRANRIVLNRELRDFTAQREAIAARLAALESSVDDPPTPAQYGQVAAVRAELDEVDGRLKGMRAILDRLTSPRQPSAYLVGFDARVDDGRAIVALGDPDTADHTGVLVPGVGTELDDIGGQISRATRLHDTATELGGPTVGGVAVIAWLGYDTPGIDGGAVAENMAETGGDNLDRFVNGLRATHEGDAAHLTVVGHSYGSAVIGEAAGDGDGLAVDDIVVAGSPGMDVTDVTELQIDPGHVWVGAAVVDPIVYGLGSLPGIHGPEPTLPQFGANTYGVDTSGHSGYWDAGSESLYNQARVIAGLYGQVTPGPTVVLRS